ncbi:MAG: hydroxyacylglutathione hydrolase [Proteobacteria bacterium]|nr:hydroxyacylglutathione hydrolase [Pseudomonadota bacterium]
MSHVVTRPREPFLVAHGRLRVHQVPAAQDNLVWLLECVATGVTAIVDGPSATEVFAYCSAHGLTPTMVLNTHTHHDHIGVNVDLAERGRLPEFTVVGSKKMAAQIPGLTQPVEDGDRVRVGEVNGTAWLTEGHIEGHITFVFDGAVFCGDTLFTGGCGYLFGGPWQPMHASLSRLAELPDETLVCCAHEYTEDNLRFAWTIEPDNVALAERIRHVWAVRAEGGCTVPSTMAQERATNPFLRGDSEGLKAALKLRVPSADVGSAGTTFAAARALKDTGAHKRVTDGDLPL